MKQNPSLCRATGASILAGAAFFAGDADAANVVVNGGFEGTTGWTGIGAIYSHPYNGISGIKLANTGGAQSNVATGGFDFNSLTYGYHDDVVQGIGSQFHGLAGGSQTISTALLAGATSLAEIDGGLANYAFSSWLASWSGDGNTPALRLQLFDADNGTGTLLTTVVLDRGTALNQITTAQLIATGNVMNGAENSSTDPDYWGLYEVKSTLPVGTRSAVIDFVPGTGHAVGGGNDWYAEAVVFDVVPEPSSALLGGLGALALLRRRRSADS